MWYNVLGRIQNDPTENFSYKRKSIHFVNTPNEDVQTEERKFVMDKSNKEYVDMAYSLYKQKKGRERIEAMMKKLG